MNSSEVAEQGSRAWVEARLGHITASRFGDVMTQPRSKADKESGKLSQTAENYMIDLLGEHLTQEPASELKTYAMEWGNRWEPVARETYRQFTKLDVVEVGFVRHPTERFIGCSPDSLVESDGLIEIKCPLTAANHVRVLIRGTVPDEHLEQIQGGLWITGRQWCDFVSYHDRFPPDLRMIVLRVERDEQFIADLAAKVTQFRDLMVGRLKELIAYWERQVA